MKKIERLLILSAIFILLFASCKDKELPEEKTDIITQTSDMQTAEDIEEAEEIIDEETEEEPQTIYYIVKLEGKNLVLYEVDGDNKKNITSVTINPENYPEEDIVKLETGVEAGYKEDGYAILENFAN